MNERSCSKSESISSQPLTCACFTSDFQIQDDGVASIEEDFRAELAQIQAESIGWIPLEEGAYLHLGSDTPVIQVVGIAKEEMAGSNVLWLT
jgi:hypothetical protein